MHKFGEMSSLGEASLESLSMAIHCQIGATHLASMCGSLVETSFKKDVPVPIGYRWVFNGLRTGD